MELARITEQTDEPFEWFVTNPPAAVVSYRSGAAPVTTSSIDRFLEQVARDVELVQSLHPLDVANFPPFDQPESIDQAVQLAAGARSLLQLNLTDPITDLVGPLAEFGLFTFSADPGPDAPDAATALLENGGVSVINSN